MLHVPTAESSILTSFLLAVRKRSRALKTSFDQRNCQLVREVSSQASQEKVELILREGRTGGGTAIRIDLWADRWCVFDIRHGGRRGWNWEWSKSGRLAGGLDPAQVLKAAEDTYRAAAEGGIDTSSAERIWRPILLDGPRLAH